MVRPDNERRPIDCVSCTYVEIINCFSTLLASLGKKSLVARAYGHRFLAAWAGHCDDDRFGTVAVHLRVVLKL